MIIFIKPSISIIIIAVAVAFVASQWLNDLLIAES